MLSDEDLQKIKRLKILLGEKVKTEIIGDEPAKLKSGSDEFLGHRGYTQGEEFKYIDWNIYARTEQLYVKEMSRQETPKVLILLDNSASMFIPMEKSNFCNDVATVFCLVAYFNFGRFLSRALFSYNMPVLFTGITSPRHIYQYFLNISEEQIPLEKSLSLLKRQVKDISFCILISDFWYEDLSHFKHIIEFSRKVGFIHILSDEELTPNLSDKVLFVDVETKRTYENFISQDEIGQYQELVNQHIQKVKDFCYRFQIRYAFAKATTNIVDFIFIDLPKADFLKVI